MVFRVIIKDSTKSEKITAWSIPAMLFLISAVYLYFFRNSLFFYQENTSLFVLSGEYLQKFIVKPGGVLECTGNFLTQGYFSPLYGALLLALINILFYSLLLKTGRKLTVIISFVRILALIPPCLLLLLQTRYEHFMYHNLGFLLVALYFLLAISSDKRSVRLISISLFPLFYYLAGSFALIFIGIYLCYSLIYENGIFRFIMPAVLLLISFISFLVFRDFLFLQPVKNLTGYPVPFTSISMLPGLLVFLFGLLILFPLLVKSSDLIKKGKNYFYIVSAAVVLTVFLITVLSLIRLYNPDLVRIIQLEQMVVEQDWDGIIRQQENSPTVNIIGQYYYNLALSEKGILCDRMFYSRQDFGSKALSLPRNNENYNRALYFYYTIGLINEARHIAYESMVAYGYRPENIKMLIKTELINGNYRVAEKYINDLKKTLNYRRWAEKYEKMLFNPVAVRANPELGGKIMLLPQTDFFIRPDDRENVNLLFLANPLNLKAFEYKIAWMLLEKDYKSAVNEIRIMKILGYKSIPRHLEEAVVGYTNITKLVPDLGGLTVRPEVETNFREYGSVYNLYSGKKELLEPEMRKVGGHTLWYYLQFK